MKKWMQMMVVVAGLASAAHAAFTGDAWPMSTAAWNAGNGTQGQYGNWSFKWAWNGVDTPADYHNAAWESNHGGWNMMWNQLDSNGNDDIYRTNVLLWYNPTRAIIAWTAPADGTYPLTVSADISLGAWDTGTRPIELSIQKNDTFLLSNTLYDATSTTHTVNLYSGNVTLKAGDVLYFRTRQSSGSDSVYESAAWNIQIPEPASLILLFLGAGGLLFRRR